MTIYVQITEAGFQHLKDTVGDSYIENCIEPLNVKLITKFGINCNVGKHLIYYHVNAHAIIRRIFKDGSIWISNLNMPYQGTISKILSLREFEELTNCTI